MIRSRCWTRPSRAQDAGGRSTGSGAPAARAGHSVLTALVLSAVMLLPLAAQSKAQAPEREHAVRELSGNEVDAANLVGILAPHDKAPPELRARSLTTPKTSCAFFRKQRARGIAVEPQSDDVALQVHFPFNSAEVTPEAAATLDELGRALRDRSLATCCFEIQGHTDSVGSESYNQSLSERRARSVVDYLVDRFDIDPDRLLTRGLGESEPVADNATEEGRSRNRRVQISNLGYGDPKS